MQEKRKKVGEWRKRGGYADIVRGREIDEENKEEGEGNVKGKMVGVMAYFYLILLLSFLFFLDPVSLVYNFIRHVYYARHNHLTSFFFLLGGLMPFQ